MSRFEEWAELPHHHVVKLRRDNDSSNKCFLLNPTTKLLRSFDAKSSVFSVALGDLREIPTALPYSPFDQHVYVAAASKSYWLAAEAVLSFDYSYETFSYVDFPPLPYIGCDIQHVLVKLHDGLLGVVCFWRRGSDVSFDEECPGYYYELWAWKEGDNGRLLLLKGISESKETQSVMLVYDWTTKECFDPHPRLYVYDLCTIPITPVLSYVETTELLIQGEHLGSQSQLFPSLTLPRRLTLSRRIQILGLNENGPVVQDKDYEYEEIPDEQYKDWNMDGFRVVKEYHPSQNIYVFKHDYKPCMHPLIRKRGYDYGPATCDINFIYIDLLKLKVDGDTQGKQLICSQGMIGNEKETPIPIEKSGKDVIGFFSKAGQVRNVKFSTDEDENIEESSTPKVVCTLNFYDAVPVPMARALSGRPAFGQALVVVKKLVESESRARVSVTETPRRTIHLERLPSCVSKSDFFEILLSYA
ncbi:hypothetical protein OROHE_001340 [Orobanche hederae]